MMMVKRGPNGPVMFSGGTDGQMEMWSPEELIMETPLSGRLKGDSQEQAATANGASEAAQKLKAHWTTFISFQKSAMGIGFRLPPPGPGGAAGSGGPDGPRFDPMKHNPNDRFARLTPEQRVQRARQGRGMIQQNIESNTERKTN